MGGFCVIFVRLYLSLISATHWDIQWLHLGGKKSHSKGGTHDDQRLSFVTTLGMKMSLIPCIFCSARYPHYLHDGSIIQSVYTKAFAIITYQNIQLHIKILCITIEKASHNSLTVRVRPINEQHSRSLLLQILQVRSRSTFIQITSSE